MIGGTSACYFIVFCYDLVQPNLCYILQGHFNVIVQVFDTVYNRTTTKHNATKS